MDKIKIKLSYQKLKSFMLCFESFVWSHDISYEMKAVKTLTEEFYFKCYKKEIDLRESKKDFNVSLRYSQAWALQQFCVHAMEGLPKDGYERNSLFTISNEIHQLL